MADSVVMASVVMDDPWVIIVVLGVFVAPCRPSAGTCGTISRPIPDRARQALKTRFRPFTPVMWEFVHKAPSRYRWRGRTVRLRIAR